ncbi:PEP-CTERM sorting domain-containing protein [Bythopirellula goksoeyrii]|uniref:Ice-binding protein C-terminal domain-containing protein n=1 Tax=Bythopirellula goksoeyrii TaxID=1400387 RepID=A0A5B9Q8Y4_9BACT|nr:PEP-CTERM sorting domain-containing protein [Bythopirellula goksoeyrii]QEG35447.1 hypothetical protein Pr1d_27460 [Bythopirellula goksoeyrii]
MKVTVSLLIASALVALPVGRSQAVELLISGDFEPPQTEFGQVPGWQLEEYFTGSAAEANTAGLVGATDRRLQLNAFAAGGPLTPGQSNFDNDNPPAGDVDGNDFFIWQRNYGLVGTALPEQGDANGDMDVDGDDLANWQSNYGAQRAGVFSNAILSQTVPGAAGETYTFQGTSEFEDNYSGLVDPLYAESPNGAIPSPTITQFRMEFLDSGGSVIGQATPLDLSTENTFPGFPVVHTPLVAVAPAGTTNVRVVAEALDMAWNGNSTTMGDSQAAFFNDFSLNSATNPGTDLLENGNLDLEIPTALDFWNQVETPPEKVEILRAGNFGFSNHTPGGTAGVWLSSFFGGNTNFATPNTDPVSGIISQTVEAVAGGTYTFSGWTKFETNFSGGLDTIPDTLGDNALFKGMPSPTTVEIRVDFLDINSVVIDSAVIDVKQARQAACGGNANDLTCGPNSDGWVQSTLQAVAPAGTIFARLTAQMLNGVTTTGQQSGFFDDFSLDGPAPGMFAATNQAVPEPTSLVILSLGTLLVGLGRSRR